MTPGDKSGDASDVEIENAEKVEVVEEEQVDLGRQGARFDRHSPFYIGFFGGLGFVLAMWLFHQAERIGGVLILIVVSLFLAAGLNPSVEWFQRRGMRRSLAVTCVIVLFLLGVALFLLAIVPVITDQVAQITDNAPGWLDQLQKNKMVQDLDDRFDVIDKVREYVTDGNFTSSIFGGVLGISLRVLGALANAFVILVLTLYFLSSLDSTKNAIYRLAPASRRDRVSKLGDRVVASVGGYVSGAVVVAACAGITSLIFLFSVGLGQYAVALAFVVLLLDVIPMIGATIGAVIVSAIGFATDYRIGLACVIFYVIYQQVENYVIYPRVMSRSVDIPGAATVIAALVGAGLLGVVGALLAIPTAAALLMITREVFIRRQDGR
ncbi:AI-2E family transporter [Nocardioides islandensis]|nr:AI-2E family transporter [Nocardioides islandensis]